LHLKGERRQEEHQHLAVEVAEVLRSLNLEEQLQHLRPE
jgi:hypothetical protein